MAIVVNTNVASLIAQNNLAKNNTALEKTLQKLSSGSKINSAKDDAAGLSIAESLTTQISGNKKVTPNAQDGQNLLAVAEGNMVTAVSNLQRIYELCLQAANGTYNESAKDTILMEIKERLDAVQNISLSANFNGIQLLGQPKAGETDKHLLLQVGIGSDKSINTIDVGDSLIDVTISTLGGDIRISAGQSGANWSIDEILKYMPKINTAIDTITNGRSKIGAYGNRLESIVDNLAVMNENLEQSKSRILDTDIAESSSDMVKYQILQQSSAAVLMQANQTPALAL